MRNRLLSLTLLALLAFVSSSCSDDKCCCTCRVNCADLLSNCHMEGDVVVCDEEDSASDAATEDQGQPQDLDQDSAANDVTADTRPDAQLPDVQPQDVADTSDDLADTAQHDVADITPTEDLEQDNTPQGPSEFRGLWVSRWDFTSAQDVADIMENAQAWGFNAVMFQVRGAADAYYQSNVEPWAKGLSGTLGKDPGWNPLQVAIDEGHARGLEVHAWLNTFPAWVGTATIPLTTPHHVLYDHPEWRQHDTSGTAMAYNSSYVFLSPGIAGARQHILNVLSDIAQNYDVDGIHLDYIRYAGPEYSHDSESEAAYDAAKVATPGLTWGDFQRDLLTSFVGQAYQTITGINPAIKVTTAVWGIYQDSFGWGGTSQGFYDYYQDSHRWTSEGIVDAICPMIYWAMTTPKGGWTDFATLADDFLASAGERHVYMGINVDYPDADEIVGQIEYARSIGAPGTILFSYAGIVDANYGPTIGMQAYSDSMPTPPMPWK